MKLLSKKNIGQVLELFDVIRNAGGAPRLVAFSLTKNDGGFLEEDAPFGLRTFEEEEAHEASHLIEAVAGRLAVVRANYGAKAVKGLRWEHSSAAPRASVVNADGLTLLQVVCT